MVMVMLVVVVVVVVVVGQGTYSRSGRSSSWESSLVPDVVVVVVVFVVIQTWSFIGVAQTLARFKTCQMATAFVNIQRPTDFLD